MILIIRALKLNDQPLSEPLVGRFDASGGTIGRSEANTMALPDPQRHISRLQAEVIAADGGYALRNAGQANAIFLNRRALAPGERGTLSHHDELQIGGYALQVQLEDESQAARSHSNAHVAVDARLPGTALAADQRTDPRRMAPKAARVPARPPSPQPQPFQSAAAPASASLAAGSSNPFADLLGPASMASASASDPFAFLDAPPASAMAPPSPAAPASAVPPRATSPMPAKGAPARLPDDFDPFADLEPMAAPAPPAAAPLMSGRHHVADDPLASVGASSGHAPGIDAAFGLASGAGSGADDALAAFMAMPIAGGAAAAGARPGPRRAPAASDHVAELQGAYRPPRIVEERPDMGDAPAVAPPWPAPATVAPAASGDTDGPALWAAFCAGAGIHVALPQGLTARQMHTLGQVLREAIDGTLRLMMVRSTAKQELRADVTTIRGRNNNPLKFSPDAQVALEQMVQPPLRGFMPAPAAMQDAMRDLLGHSIGTMAGMRAALADVLQRFEPSQLEAKLADKSMLDNLLASNRKAKLWDLYLLHFDAIRNEAQDDFQTLFGKAFVAAYEAQLKRLPDAGDGDGVPAA